MCNCKVEASWQYIKAKFTERFVRKCFAKAANLATSILVSLPRIAIEIASAPQKQKLEFKERQYQEVNHTLIAVG